MVRHGESEWNLQGRLQGQTLHVPLTALGLEQAERAAETVATLVPHGTEVFSSDQLRAHQTALRVAAVLGSTVQTTPLLREQALGELEGRLTSELVEEPVPDGMHLSEVCWGGGESVQQVHARCVQLLATLPVRDHLVLVSHGDLLRVLLAVLDGRSHRDVEWTAIGNGEVLVREVDPVGARRIV